MRGGSKGSVAREDLQLYLFALFSVGDDRGSKSDGPADDLAGKFEIAARKTFHDLDARFIVLKLADGKVREPRSFVGRITADLNVVACQGIKDIAGERVDPFVVGIDGAKRTTKDKLVRAWGGAKVFLIIRIVFDEEGENDVASHTRVSKDMDRGTARKESRPVLLDHGRECVADRLCIETTLSSTNEEEG